MSQRSISSSRLLAAVLLLGLVAAGCSGGPANSGPTSAAASTSSRPAPTAIATATSAGVPGADICALLPADQVAQITGLTITGATPRTSSLIPNDVGCTYGQNNVLIDVVTPGGAAAYNDQVTLRGSNADPITGFGDKAFQDFTDGTGLVALFGDIQFDVFVLDSTNTMTFDDINRVSEALITALRGKM